MGQLITRTVGRIGGLDPVAMDAARRRQDSLTKPRGSLGLLEELSVRIAGMRGKILPGLPRRVVVVMAADHGVVSEGITLYPQEVTRQMVANFLAGGAGINVLADMTGARVVVVDMGMAAHMHGYPDLVEKRLGEGTQNMVKGPAMSREQAVRAVETGIEVAQEELAKGIDILATGDMGMGNTTASSAVCAALTGAPAETVTGRGVGLGDDQLTYKVAVVRRALEVNRPDPADPLDVLAKVGGFEIGGLAGVMLATAAERLPVVIDGFISGAAALIAAGIAPQVKNYLIAGHLSADRGHPTLLRHLGLTPLLSLEMRLGEGTGAVLAMTIVEAAMRTLVGMKTFEEAGVSQGGKRSGS
ncbi:MAG: nicotinate-nucleotide--dimethylbenzimidazole phosphoribosyltransferase [Chloroflexota bacterium]